MTDVNKHLSDLGLSQVKFVTRVCIRVSFRWYSARIFVVSYGSLEESAIIVRVGGRHGCVFGSGFNTPYALALMALNDELMNRGVVMRIHDGNITNGTSDSSCEEVHHVLYVTFVDDECIMLAADDSRSLAAAIDCCTLVLSTTFQLLKLEVNWRPGKTGCLVQMSGKRWAQVVESVHFFESALDDRAAMSRTVAATLSKACVCSVCNKKVRF